MRARNEVEAMALKAARGAGAPLGHAEDFARAAGAMAMADAAALDSLSNALDGPFEVDASGIPLRLVGPCMMVMPLAIDALRSGEAEVLLPGAHPPALVQAYIRVAAQDFDIALEISGEKLRLGAVQPPAALPAKAVAVPDAIWRIWDALAAKTYVPETESSRLAGAGAGLTDND